MEELIKKDEIDFDLKIWVTIYIIYIQEKEFDIANPNPEDNSDLDDDNITNPLYTKSAI